MAPFTNVVIYLLASVTVLVTVGNLTQATTLKRGDYV